MSEKAWTPGPWEVHHRHGVTDQFDIMPVASRGLGWVTLPQEDLAGVGEYMQVGGPCTAATARLIAAAPDMAEAAIEIDRLSLVILSAVNYADRAHLEAVSDALKTARAALSKALGSGGGE